ncbi:MAG: exodeoxyribonuclease VII large subunit [Deltaproteobacteria bacterium]|nr:exodeoxyribonuclease VII large subunit [Deltaproteobacteria bacterium]
MQRYTVSFLVRTLGQIFDARFPDIEVEGETARISAPASGHRYFDLRHEDATIAAVVWRTRWGGLSYQPRVGERVICRGRVGIFPRSGATQLYVTDITPAGRGDWAEELRARKARLAADGLLDPGRKRPLPAHPRVVGVATSLTGAALQDFLVVSRRRFPAARVVVAGCLVQGERAAQSVIEAVQLLERHGAVEVIVVTRGGGSEKDLVPFQDEGLCRAIAASRVPVLTAVGHQIDTSLVDLVADASAPTPSAAAERLFPDGPALAQRIDEGALGLERALGRRLALSRERVEQLRARLRSPEERLAGDARRLHELESRLEVAVVGALRVARARVEEQQLRADRAPTLRLERAQARLEGLEGRLPLAWERHPRRARAQLGAAAAGLSALSPLDVLGRGYAIVRGQRGVLTSAGQASPGEVVEVLLRHGTLSAQVLAQGAPGPTDGEGAKGELL